MGLAKENAGSVLDRSPALLLADRDALQNTDRVRGSVKSTGNSTSFVRLRRRRVTHLDKRLAKISAL